MNKQILDESEKARLKQQEHDELVRKMNRDREAFEEDQKNKIQKMNEKMQDQMA